MLFFFLQVYKTFPVYEEMENPAKYVFNKISKNKMRVGEGEGNDDVGTLKFSNMFLKQEKTFSMHP